MAEPAPRDAKRARPAALEARWVEKHSVSVWFEAIHNTIQVNARTVQTPRQL